MTLNLYQESRIGPRRNNQDRLLCRNSSEALLMVVADGMGGHRLGEVAAQVATIRFAKFFELQAKPRIDDPARFLLDAFLDAHLAVKALADGRPRAPHTTCVACLVQDGRAWWAHCGDSRLYLIRDGRLLTRTKDHSFVEGLVQRGLVNEDDVRKHPQRHMVLSCLGARENPVIDRAAHDLRDGDVILLCSDGLWESLREQTLISTLCRGDMGKVAPQLLNFAENNAGDNGDNLTLIALRWKGDNAGPDTIANFPDTIDVAQGASLQILSDTDIDRAIADIQSRIKHK